MQERFFDPYRLIQAKLVDIWNLFFLQLPNLLGGLVFLILLWLVTRVLRRWIMSLTHRRKRGDLGELLASITTAAVMGLGLLISAAIVFPSVTPSGILSTLGIGSVAIGFAFRDILQNLFAGVLIVITRPFIAGDVIATDKYEGTVERVEARATIIRTSDGRRVAIPNSILYTAPVTINTANSSRRDEFEVILAPGQEMDAVVEAISGSVAEVDGVLKSPGPEVVGQAMSGDGLHALVRWWTPTRGANRIAIHSEVVHAVSRAVAASNIVLAPKAA
jgi:small-conductance mechanosensitive channel